MLEKINEKLREFECLFCELEENQECNFKETGRIQDKSICCNDLGFFINFDKVAAPRQYNTEPSTADGLKLYTEENTIVWVENKEKTFFQNQNEAINKISKKINGSFDVLNDVCYDCNNAYLEERHCYKFFLISNSKSDPLTSLIANRIKSKFTTAKNNPDIMEVLSKNNIYSLYFKGILNCRDLKAELDSI